MVFDSENLQKTKCSCSFCNFDEYVQSFALDLVDGFFLTKQLHPTWKSLFLCGNSIPQSWLRDHQRLSLLFELSIDEAAERVYQRTSQPNLQMQHLQTDNKDIPWDIFLVSESLQLLIKEKIPQKYSGGMLLLYLELCKGLFLD